MKGLTILGAVLALAGLLALVYPNVPAGTKKDVVKIGPIESTIETKQYYVVPPVVAALVLAGGVALVVFSRIKEKE